jgi:uncharacterized protein YecT (DUF1311 family)
MRMHRLLWSTRKAPRAALPILVVLALPACDKPKQPPTPEPKTKHVAENACGNQAAFDQLKAFAFRKAKDVRTRDAATLDRLATAAVVRMSDPAEEGRDEALNATVCKGRMAIDLPPGFTDAFNGDRSMAADVKYGVQAGVDHRMRAYPIEGIEPIVYRLAAIDLKGGVQVAQSAVTPAPVRRSALSPAPATPARPAQRVAGLEPRLSIRGRPAFSCYRVRSRAERMICADERLAAFDRVMASLYDRALDDSDRETRAILRGTQNRFFARRDRCRDAGCMAAVYRDRLDEIDRIVSEG